MRYPNVLFSMFEKLPMAEPLLSDGAMSKLEFVIFVVKYMKIKHLTGFIPVQYFTFSCTVMQIESAFRVTFYHSVWWYIEMVMF